MDRIARASPLIGLALAGLALDPISAQTTTDRNWPETARRDLLFINQTLIDNHPAFIDSGPIADRYRGWRKAALPVALARARTANDYAGYFFAVSGFVQGFQDGHLYALQRDDRLPYRWPGFLTSFDGKAFRVQAVTADATRQGLGGGATLIGCDGQPALVLAKNRLHQFVGQWSLPARRPSLAPYLLVDEGNPFVPRLKACTFSNHGRRRVVPLSYQPTSYSALRPALLEAAGRIEQPIELRRFGPDAYWFAISSFATGNPQRAAALERLIHDEETQAADIRRSRLIVFDVRGNGGGVSAIGERIAAALWGERTVREKAPIAHAVDWRASAATADYLERTILPRFRQQLGTTDRNTLGFAHVAAGIRAALAKREPFFRQDEAEFYPPSDPGDRSFPVSARIFILADGGCASACLDFLDLLKAIGPTTQVGAATSADAMYIDNRQVSLPSGLGSLGVSMKVYRDRPRGHNQSYVPKYVFPGSMTDTKSLERWILVLSQRRLR